jgi:hypothetical protein
VEIKTATADFSNPISGSGPRTQIVPVIFPTAVQNAAVGLTGYTVAYGNNDDHHVGLINVAVDSAISSNVVLVTATLGLRDWSGNWDDTYFGSVEFAVLAELAAVPPRPDLIVSELETNQSVQFFHSASYLTPLTAVPDNGISLYAGKNTGLRVYPDWDAALGLPLSALTGAVTVKQANGTTSTLQPLNPGGSIVPRAADTINQALIEHTLNFMIPGAICTDSLELTIQLWDQANPASKSGIFTRTLTFASLPELNIFVVGVHYTAQNLDLAAPTQAAFTSAGFAYMQQVYPMGSIVQTGYTTIDYGEDVNFTIGSQGGCGKGMGDLLDRMDEMRGSSNEVYLAVLPPLSQIQEMGSNIGGCGRTGAGAVFIDFPQDVPHEVGHALGRAHAPCDPGQCNPMPANVDGNYPSYGALPAGSIGAFGFDPVGYQVLNPASTFDTMAYRFPQWISAYTYLALAGAGHPSEGGTGAGLGSAHATTDVPIDTLFLGLSINRDRHVRRRVSFHYPALPRAQQPCHEYVAELLDVDREVLICAPLSCDCDEVGHHCWPKRFRTALPYPKGSRWLLIWEGDRKLYEEWIPRPPKVTIERIEQDGDEVVIRWCGEREGDYDDADEDAGCCELWYLVQWYDEYEAVWRGVAPRSRVTHLRLPPALLRGAELLRLRVLASCGIATGVANFEVKGTGRGDPRVDIVAVRDGATLGAQITAIVVDPRGRHLDLASASWVVGDREVARGASLDLRALPQGRSEVHAFVQTEDAGGFCKSWVIRRDGGRFLLEEEGPQRRTRAPEEPHHHPHAKPGR